MAIQYLTNLELQHEQPELLFCLVCTILHIKVPWHTWTGVRKNSQQVARRLSAFLRLALKFYKRACPTQKLIVNKLKAATQKHDTYWMELPALAFAAYSAFSVITFTWLLVWITDINSRSTKLITYSVRVIFCLSFILHCTIIKSQKLVIINTKI